MYCRFIELVRIPEALWETARRVDLRSPTTRKHTCRDISNFMKPQIEEVEDDLAAEEENKLINEVRSLSMMYGVSQH